MFLLFSIILTFFFFFFLFFFIFSSFLFCKWITRICMFSRHLHAFSFTNLTIFSNSLVPLSTAGLRRACHALHTLFCLLSLLWIWIFLIHLLFFRRFLFDLFSISFSSLFFSLDVRNPKRWVRLFCQPFSHWVVEPKTTTDDKCKSPALYFTVNLWTEYLLGIWWNLSWKKRKKSIVKYWVIQSNIHEYISGLCIFVYR